MYFQYAMHHTNAEDPATYTKDSIQEYLKTERLKRFKEQENGPTSPAPGDSVGLTPKRYSKSKAEKQIDIWDKKVHDATKFPIIKRNEDYVT